MLVSVSGFGSIWRQRCGDTVRKIAYYNTTGVRINGMLRQRPAVLGYARFNAAGGFNANSPLRMMDRVFECQPLCLWNGANKVLFERLLPRPEPPDQFLVAVRSSDYGTIEMRHADWKDEPVLVLAMSQSRDEQETLLLMPAGTCVRTTLGTLILKHMPSRPWVARLELKEADQCVTPKAL